MKNNIKILSRTALKNKLLSLRRSGKKIAFTNGCFDILHYGHISYLQKAKKKDRILIIGLNSDKSVQKIKGKKRPIVSQAKRAAVLASLECVDFVTMFNEETPEKLIGSIMPDILIKGADWKGKEIAGGKAVKKNGGKIEFIKYIKGCSTTDIIKDIIKKCGK